MRVEPLEVLAPAEPPRYELRVGDVVALDVVSAQGSARVPVCLTETGEVLLGVVEEASAGLERGDRVRFVACEVAERLGV